jgi:hypothetical protein
VVEQVHLVDELRLTGEIHVVGAVRGARGDQRFAVLEIGPDGGDHDAGPRRHRVQGRGVGDVCMQQLHIREPRVDAGQIGPDRLQLAGAAACQCPPQVVGSVAGEVFGSEGSGETSRPEHHDVEVTSVVHAPESSPSEPKAEPDAAVDRPIPNTGTNKGTRSCDSQSAQG